MDASLPDTPPRDELRRPVIEYFSVLDSSLDTLSMHHEGQIAGLPLWAHTTRRITVGVTDSGKGLVVKVVPDTALSEDLVDIVPVKSSTDLSELISPMAYNGPSPDRLDDSFAFFADMFVTSEPENPLATPLIDARLLIGLGGRRGFQETFTAEKAKEFAIELWSGRHTGQHNYVQQVRSILERLKSMVRRKCFVERRVHRFIHEHRHILLPPHNRCLFDHPLYRGEAVRKADFILERGGGFPALLIELESPVHAVLTKSLNLTAPANHARQQISEWVAWIDSGAMRNAQGEHAFVTGPKDRLVVIGRGLDHRERLLETKFDGTLIWTYDMFLEEARRRLNESYSAQCNMLGLAPQHPF